MLDARSLSHLAAVLDQTSSDLRLAFLPVPDVHSERNTTVFNQVYKFWRDHWLHSFGFTEEGQEQRQLSDAFLSTCKQSLSTQGAQLTLIVPRWQAQMKLWSCLTLRA